MIELVGIVKNIAEEYDELNSKLYYNAVIDVERSSGAVDSLNLRWEDKVTEGVVEGSKVYLTGNVRSYKTDTIPRTKIKVYVRKFVTLDDEEYEQQRGTNNFSQKVTVIKKADRVRETPSGCRIFDVVATVTRVSGHTDKINCLFWQNAAVAAWSKLQLGQEITVVGRLQSRTYIKEEVEYSVTELSVVKWN